MAKKKTKTPKKIAKKVKGKTKPKTKAKKPIKKLAKKKVVAKKTKKVVKSKKKQVKSSIVINKREAAIVKKEGQSLEEKTNQKVEALVVKGRSRGFITYSEILKEFPNIENDILWLDQLYTRLEESGVDILEEGSLLDSDIKIDEKIKVERGDVSLDSVQMYLREIGKHRLLTGSEEKELTKSVSAATIK
jgi:RNA polymerase primary sigma factor